MYSKQGNYHIVKGKGTLELIQAKQPTETLESIYSRLERKPYALFNAGLFNMSNGQPVTGLIVNKQMIREKGGAGSVIYGNPARIESLGEKWMGYYNWTDWALESGPLLLPNFNPGRLDNGLVNGSHPRIAVGYGTELVVLATDPRPFGITCRQLADEMKRLGCTHAINLDGGGSVGLLINGKRVTGASRSVDTALALYLEVETTGEKPLLIIDPGHGGKDPGGGTNTHWKEKDLVLQISLYQRDRFKQLGIPVVLTREDDRTIDSKERTAIVRNSGAVFCLSNHANAGGGRGWEIIHSIYDDGKLARAIEKEFAPLGIPKRRIFTRTLPQNAKKDYYFMHRETGAVATNIIEYGFADNELDTKYLLGHWQDMAEAVVKAFCGFVGKPYQPHMEKPKEETLKDWKQEAVEWMYDEGLLTGEEWKQKIDEPLPLWALATVLKRFKEKGGK